MTKLTDLEGNETALPWALAEPDTAKPETPLALLARLSAGNAISPDERDAGEMLARMAAFVMGRPSATGAHAIPLRDAEGKWSEPVLRGQEIKARYEAALAAIRTDARRRAVTIGLVARERDTEWTEALTDALSCGLEDLVRHFWPSVAPARATITINGVSLPSVARGNEDATPERLAKAANDNTIGKDGVRRITESPFARMHARGQLDPDAGINEILYSAGRNYFQNWYYGGLAGISGIDYSRIGSGGDGKANMLPRSEFALGHRERWRAAREDLGPRYSEIVDPIVLEERTIADIRGATGYKHDGTASAVTKERLNTALRRLAVFYGLMRKPSEASRAASFAAQAAAQGFAEAEAMAPAANMAKFGRWPAING